MKLKMLSTPSSINNATSYLMKKASVKHDYSIDNELYMLVILGLTRNLAKYIKEQRLTNITRYVKIPQ